MPGSTRQVSGFSLWFLLCLFYHHVLVVIAVITALIAISIVVELNCMGLGVQHGAPTQCESVFYLARLMYCVSVL